MDPNYEPQKIERKTIFGLTLEQKINDAVIDKKLFAPENVVSDSKKVDTICHLSKI